MPEPAKVEQLAQRALGDVFEQLERVGTAGREKCTPASTAYYNPSTLAPLEQQLKRHEAVELIRMAESALDYARLHLDFLPIDPAERPRFRTNDRVIVVDEEGSWHGTLEGRERTTRQWRVRANDGSGPHLVDERDLREVAQ